MLTRCGLSLPVYLLADEKHSKCLTERVYLPTIVSGRVLWHLGYSASKSAVAFTESYGTGCEFYVAQKLLALAPV